MSRNVLSRTNSSILFRISEVRKITQKEGAAIKIAKEVAREAAKEEKVAKKVARESAKEEKVAKKVAKKVARESAKEAAKEEKIIAERASKEKKRADREEKIATRKVEKIKQRELTLAIRHHVKEKYIALTEKQLQKKIKNLKSKHKLFPILFLQLEMRQIDTRMASQPSNSLNSILRVMEILTHILWSR